MKFDRIGIIGGGAWGTALAMVARRAARGVSLWAREADVVDAINRHHVNRTFLPNAQLDPGIVATTALGTTAKSDMVLLVTPAQATRAVATALLPHLARKTPVVLCAKGIESDSGKLMTEVAREVFGERPLAVLSGPTFAEEVAAGLPTAVTLACADRALGEAMAAALATATFRPYWSADPTGAALGGAVKNVLAIACGVVEGCKLGNNARAALMTRGFAEMMRLGEKLGARRETLAGLAGLGDLTLTCHSAQSRNLSFGIALGHGGAAANLLSARPQVVEGAYTAGAVSALARNLGVDMPICAAVDAIVNRGAKIGATIDALLARPLRAEHE